MVHARTGDREGYVERGRLDKACGRFGIEYQTAAHASHVAAAFPESFSRLKDLSWSHHQAVANHPQAGELLEWAAESGATVKQLRERVREIRAAEAPPRRDSPRHLGRILANTGTTPAH